MEKLYLENVMLLKYRASKFLKIRGKVNIFETINIALQFHLNLIKVIVNNLGNHFVILEMAFSINTMFTSYVVELY